jgi:transposase-like protein
VRKPDRKRPQGQEVRIQRVLPLVAQLRQGLQQFVIDSGMGVLQAILEEERTARCGPRYAHDAERVATRAGTAPGELVMGGRRVRVKRPRARTMDGHEVTLPSWSAFTAEDPLDDRAVEQMVVGVATRKYGRSLEPLPEGIESRGTSRSAVSRRFVRKTGRRLQEVLSQPLTGLDLLVLMIDGVHFADHVVLVALGIDSEGRKHVLGLREGATENASACTALLGDLVERGLQTDRSILAVLDGSRALRKALVAHFGNRVHVQRCQEHKKRNVLDQLPDKLRPSVKAALNEAYRTGDATRARKLLDNLARRLESDHPGAASSLREGLEETLTVMAWRLPRPLERTLSTTNPIENLMGSCRRVTRNVKRWRGGEMILRWMAAGIVEAARGFRRLRGHAGMPQLAAALRAADAALEPKSKIA